MKKDIRVLALLLLVSRLVLHGQTAPSSAATAASSQVSTEQAADPQAIRKFNEEKVAELEKQIAGKEDQPSGVVFKNIQMFTPVPAGRLLKMMQFGFSNSLGVSCAHCHVVGEWDKDDKPQKQVARDMMKMVRTINNDLLKNIKNLKGPNPIVNCTTCHRGQVKPALDLETAGK